MPLTNAERMKRYREKIKQDPEKYKKYKEKHAKLVKSKSKKIAQLTNEEKEVRRKKWREDKKRQKEAKKTISNLSKTQPQRCDKVVMTKSSLIRIRQQHKTALKRIAILSKILLKTRKRFCRFKIKTIYENKTIQDTITKMKVREEVLESALKSFYQKCKKREEKNLMKSIVQEKNIKSAKMKTKFSKILGLKGKIRKSKEIVTNHKTQKEMETFFNRDDVSRITAGKRECRTFKKQKEQIRYLCDTLKVLYQKYKSEGGRYSFSTFFKYKPFYVISPNVTNRNTCLCIRHSNIDLLLYALHKNKLISNLKTIKHVLDNLCCDLNSYECMHGFCDNCKNKALDYQLIDEQSNLIVNWFQWERIEHKYEKCENGKTKTAITKKTAKVIKSGTIKKLIEEFEGQLTLFNIHFFTWNHQQIQYQKCINELKENEALILCDFSENYKCKLASEVQSMHFGAAKAQITLHTGMIYWKNSCQSFCTIADSNCHEPQAIWAHLLPIINLIKLRSKTTVIHFYSDGPSSQYRQKKNFYLHNYFTVNLGLDYSTWSFTESGHGKGVADGIGGAVKRALDRQVAYGHDISDAQDAHSLLQNCMKSVKCLLITDSDINNVSKIVPKNLKAVKGTMKIHQITSHSSNQIIHRTHSCFCSFERGMGACFSPQAHVFEELNQDISMHTKEEENIIRNKNQENAIINDANIIVEYEKTEEEIIVMNTKENEIIIEKHSNDSIDYDYLDFNELEHTAEDKEIKKCILPLQIPTENYSKKEQKIKSNVEIYTVYADIHKCDDDLNLKPTRIDAFDDVLVSRDANLNSTAVYSPDIFSPQISCNNPSNTEISSFDINPPKTSSYNYQNVNKKSCLTNMDQKKHSLSTGFITNAKNLPFKSIHNAANITDSSDLINSFHSIPFHSPLKRQSTLSLRERDMKRLRALNSPIDKSVIRIKKENLISLKTIVKRTVICSDCKKEFPFQTSMAKCMVCKHNICLGCSHGLQYFDFICNPCLGE